MRRRVVDVVCDEAGDRVAVLSCAHRQHVRLMPPLTRRPWTQTSDDRASMLGKTMECTTCERLELRDHETTVGVWGRIRVLEGALHYHVSAPFVHHQRVVAGGTRYHCTRNAALSGADWNRILLRRVPAGHPVARVVG